MSKLTRQRLNEVSAELMKRAEQKQREILKDENYLKSISAWKYIKSLKRADDFKDYADQILSAMEKGNVGNPDEKPVDLSYVNTPSHVDLTAVSVQERRKQIKAIRMKDKSIVMQRADTVIPQFEHMNDRNVGVYSIIYRSSMDDDIAAVWVSSATSINNAIQEAMRMFWDMAEIVDVIYEGKNKQYGPEDTFDVGYSENVKSLDDFKNVQEAAKEVASTLTNGEFNNITELVADCHDDQTTEECRTGHIYEGVDVNGDSWKGEKSSYRDILDEGKYSSSDDYNVDLVEKVNTNGQDTISKTKFNADAFRKALRNGVVHFVFIKKTNNAERQAFGTTNEDILDNIGVVPSTQQQYTRNTSPNIIVYYDMTSHGWRSCIKSNITLIYDESY